ncbi:SDR family oxidoreductase [Natrinema versiforme]|uniref:Short-chain dehydrogenase/reductase SDR n=1 Tax=Natrinema versiforme JCM 10478 TaxID=1227496 RepID=L9XN54_9EURY|nr:SDR family oxidoreductase [Natrinema versiforme]ELY63229.1 short-chain dehydrogenase/reductase SDR [Natrinema versiforme JCM 10478]
MSGTTDSEVVVVTGASAGVGRATARAFAERGAKIGLLARGEEGLEGAREDVEEAGGEAVVVPTDVADSDAVEAAAETVEDEFGPIDVWVNNAMVSVFSPAAEMTAADYHRVTEVTYLGYVNGTLAALERMRPRDEGTIVQVGSALAYRGIPLQSAYCGAKHAIQGFTESVRTELIHDDCDVQLSMVQMPAMNTPQFEWSKSRMPRKPQPVPPIYQPEVAARAICWAVDHGRDELWVGRSTVKAILGNRLIPRRLDNYLASGGYDSQLTDEPVDPDREHNLTKPVAGDFGARGPFEDRARERSYQLQASMHRRALALITGLIAAIASAVLGWRVVSTDSN